MLGRAGEVWNCFHEMKIVASSVAFAVLGEVTFTRLCKSGLRLLGCWCEVEVFGDERLDALCD